VWTGGGYLKRETQKEKKGGKKGREKGDEGEGTVVWRGTEVRKRKEGQGGEQGLKNGVVGRMGS